MVRLEQVVDTASGKKYFLLTISEGSLEFKKLFAEVTERLDYSTIVPCENPTIFIEK